MWPADNSGRRSSRSKHNNNNNNNNETSFFPSSTFHQDDDVSASTFHWDAPAFDDHGFPTASQAAHAQSNFLADNNYNDDNSEGASFFGDDLSKGPASQARMQFSANFESNNVFGVPEPPATPSSRRLSDKVPQKPQRSPSSNLSKMLSPRSTNSSGSNNLRPIPISPENSSSDRPSLHPPLSSNNKEPSRRSRRSVPIQSHHINIDDEEPLDPPRRSRGKSQSRTRSSSLHRKATSSRSNRTKTPGSSTDDGSSRHRRSIPTTPTSSSDNLFPSDAFDDKKSKSSPNREDLIPSKSSSFHRRSIAHPRRSAGQLTQTNSNSSGSRPKPVERTASSKNNTHRPSLSRGASFSERKSTRRSLDHTTKQQQQQPQPAEEHSTRRGRTSRANTADSDELDTRRRARSASRGRRGGAALGRHASSRQSDGARVSRHLSGSLDVPMTPMSATSNSSGGGGGGGGGTVQRSRSGRVGRFSKTNSNHSLDVPMSPHELAAAALETGRGRLSKTSSINSGSHDTPMSPHDLAAAALEAINLLQGLANIEAPPITPSTPGSLSQSTREKRSRSVRKMLNDSPRSTDESAEHTLTPNSSSNARANFRPSLREKRDISKSVRKMLQETGSPKNDGNDDAPIRKPPLRTRSSKVNPSPQTSGRLTGAVASAPFGGSNTNHPPSTPQQGGAPPAQPRKSSAELTNLLQKLRDPSSRNLMSGNNDVPDTKPSARNLVVDDDDDDDNGTFDEKPAHSRPSMLSRLQPMRHASMEDSLNKF